MVDLTTTYLGLNLKNPLVASASPLSEKVDNVRKLEDAGVSAVVMYSMFEEQIVHESLELDHFLSYGSYSSAEASSYLVDLGKYSVGPEVYLEHLRKVKAAVNIPVIGSLNGVSTGGWIEYARQMEQAGADAIELNIYYLSTDPEINSDLLEQVYVTLVRDIRERVQIPIAVKLSPFFTGLANFCRKLSAVGADGLVLFNRFYQPDFDLETLQVVPNLQLSTSQELRLPLRWIALLYGNIDADFALTTGVHTAEDMLKGVMAGASVTMTTSALLRNGIGHATRMLADLENWMVQHEYQSIRQMKGSMSEKSIGDASGLTRANYMKMLNSFTQLP
jgi:dihydroorotate dehydrogenase (fumarate)